MVREQARAYLAGPAILRAATGEEATEEELGGAAMHSSISGLADYVAEDDLDGIEHVREIVSNFGWEQDEPAIAFTLPEYDADEILGLMPVDVRLPVDMR